jgi:hypothetical protein
LPHKEQISTVQNRCRAASTSLSGTPLLKGRYKYLMMPPNKNGKKLICINKKVNRIDLSLASFPVLEKKFLNTLKLKILLT